MTLGRQHLVKILQPSQPRIECVLTSIRPYAARRLDGLHSSPPFSGENGMSDKRTKTNSERIHRLDEQARSSPVTWHAPAVKRVAGTAFPRFLRALTLAFGVIAGAAAPSLAPAADETPAAFISTIGNDALAEMRSTASLDQKLAYFRQMLSKDFDLDGISRFVLGPYWRTASPEQQQEFRTLLEKHIMLSHATPAILRCRGLPRGPGFSSYQNLVPRPSQRLILLDWNKP